MRAGREEAHGTREKGMGRRCIQDLDGLCLTCIMGCLDSPSLEACSLVCREWLEMSSLAESVHIGTLRKLPRILTRFPWLRTIYLHQDFEAPLRTNQPGLPVSSAGPSLQVLAHSCRQLQSLYLMSSVSVSDMGLAFVLKGCPNLKELVVRRCRGFSGAAFEGLRCRLEKLSLSSCAGLTNEGLGAVAMACPALRILTVENRVGMNMQGDCVVLALGVEGFAQNCPQLQELAVSGYGVTDFTLRSFGTKCPMLHKVVIKYEPDVTDMGIAALVQLTLPCLANLTLSENRQLIQLPCIIQSKQLRVLGIGGMMNTPDMVLRQISEVVSLEDLRFEELPALTDATVEKIMLNCSHLKQLLIRRCDLVIVKT